jgi:hypothetical protein
MDEISKVPDGTQRAELCMYVVGIIILQRCDAKGIK